MEDTQTTANLAKPLNINVQELQKYIPNSRYRAPFKNSLGELITSEYISNSNDYSSMIGFNGKTENGFTQIIADISLKELANLLEKVPEEMKNPLIEALKGTKLEIPELTESDKKQIQVKKQREKLLENANKIGQEESVGKFTSEDAYGIIQGSVGYTNSTSQKPILGTYGAGPCIIVAMYNSETKKAALSHIDTSLDMNKTLNNMISSIQSSQDKKLSIHLRGGDSSAKNQAKDLLNYLSKRGDVEIKSCSLVTYTSDRLAIDSRTGDIYTNFQVNQLEAHPECSQLIQRHVLQIMSNNLSPAGIQFDGRQEKYQQKDKLTFVSTEERESGKKSTNQ